MLRNGVLHRWANLLNDEAAPDAHPGTLASGGLYSPISVRASEFTTRAVA
jgi:hypothetical protein